jgi:hypothetical protein
MAETFNEDAEYGGREAWRQAFDLEKEIYFATNRIDPSGSDFLARETFEEQIRKQNAWYEKWVAMSSKDMRQWASQYSTFRLNEDYKNKKSPHSYEYYLNLAEQYHKQALEFLNPTPNLKEVVKKVENDSIENSAKEFENLLEEYKGKKLKELAKAFLRLIEGFKKEFIYRELSDNNKTYFDEYYEVIESNIDDSNVLEQMIPRYIAKLAQIIRKKKDLNFLEALKLALVRGFFFMYILQIK